MAKNFNYTRNTTDKISVKGTLSEDGTTIIYLDEDKIEKEISIAKCLHGFRSQAIQFSVSVKDDSELEIVDEE